PASSPEDFVAFGRALAMKGVSITVPYKVAMFDHVDEVYAVARRIGAINTIKALAGRWVGGNTDAVGFLQPLQHRSLNNIPASILGAGGAARAVAVALASAGARVRVHARRAEQAEDVAVL